MVNVSDTDVSNATADAAFIIIRSFPLSYAGDWTNAVPATQQNISDSDASNATADGNEAFLKADTDVSNAAADSQSVPDVTDTEVCLGSDQVPLIALSTATDMSNPAVDAGEFVGIGKSDTDSSHATVDAGERVSNGISDFDASNAASEAQSLHVTLSDSEQSTGAESSLIAATLSSADASNSALDNGERAGPTDSDHSNAATENVTRTIIIDSDQSNPAVENYRFPTAPFDADSVTGQEAARLSSVALADQDSAHASEQAWVDIPGQTTGLIEAFSVSRAAILNRATGLESAVLQGVRSGSLILTAQAVSSMADDTEILTWYNATSAALELIQAYVPMAVIATLVNTPLSSSGISPQDKYAIPVAVQQQLTGAEVPILISCPARDPLQGTSPLHKGGPRALSLIIYKVRITQCQVAPAGYKQGLNISLSGTALLSTQDEAGNPLPSADGQQGQFGRLVSSPDPSGLIAHAPLTAQLFGTGT